MTEGNTMVRPLRHLAAFMIGTAALAVSCALPALAQQGGVTPFGRAKEERVKAMSALPNWSGLWNPVGGLIFDPATADPKGNNAQRPGDREHPPYNAEGEAKYRAKLAHALAATSPTRSPTAS